MSSRARELIAATVSAAVILAAPVMGQVRAALQSAFPKQFVAIVGASVAGAIAIALVAAVVRIQTRRGARYAAIGLAFLVGTAYSLASGSGNPDVDSVERVHFVEYGVITILFYRAWKENGDSSVFILPVFAGLLIGTLDEWLQWFVPVRVGEMRDVLLNLVAISCGLLVAGAIEPPHPGFSTLLRPKSAVRVGAAGAAVVLVFASFVNAVHVGYLVKLDHVGVFRSHYTLEQLDALARDRTDRWQTIPPTVLRRFSREDQYMDEGFWHIQRRNESWTTGNFSDAWHENQVLERFFTPVLDTPSYEAPKPSRWSVEQRVDGQRLAAQTASASPFISDAQPYPILIWPQGIFWSVVALAVFAALTWARLNTASAR